MLAADDVTPQKWSEIRVLFDNGEYSVISGVYEREERGDRRSLGERWNGAGEDQGFPKVLGHPMWYVAPQFLEIPILHGLLEELAKNLTLQPRERMQAVVEELATRVRVRDVDQLAAPV
jgi:hypothetical protein